MSRWPKTMRHLPAVTAALALAGVACSSTPAPEPRRCEAYVVPPTLDLRAPVVRFRGDVLPIFVQSCAFAACHGNESSRNSAGLYLGTKTGVTDATRVRTALLERSVELVTARLVVPDRPADSYLMHKLDGDHCLRNAECVEGSCGDTMPHDNERLATPVRDTIRRWIAQGAQDD